MPKVCLMNELICNQQQRECVYKSTFSQSLPSQLGSLPLHILFVTTPICNQPRRLEMNRTVLILLSLAALVAVGYALPADSENRPTTELETHALERLSNEGLEELSRSRRFSSCNVFAALVGLRASTTAAMTCATAALSTAPAPPMPITTVEIMALVQCALNLITANAFQLVACLA